MNFDLVERFQNSNQSASFPGPSVAWEPGTVTTAIPITYSCGYGFRVRRFAAPRNDGIRSAARASLLAPSGATLRITLNRCGSLPANRVGDKSHVPNFARLHRRRSGPAVT